MHAVPEHCVADGAHLRFGRVPAEHVFEATPGNRGEVELASDRLLETRLPVVCIDEEAVDAVFDGALKRVRR